MSRSRTLLIVIALALLVGLAVIALRPDEPVAVSNSGSPAFDVRVVKPLLARPLFGLFGVLPSTDLGFDHTSPGAGFSRVGRDRLELNAQGWDLSIETDGDGNVAPGTRLVFTLELGGRDQTLRCRPAVPAIGYLRNSTQAGSDEAGGRFHFELATCENARTGKVIEWPPAPLTVLGSFDRLPVAPG